jgi:lipoprotein-anchoring transpeptidase ErfK/SrfK
MSFWNHRWLLPAILCLPMLALVVSVPRLLERTRALNPPLHLKVDLSERRLYLIEADEIVGRYRVAVGSRKHPTPTGHFRTGRIDWNPSWRPPPSKWARKLKPRAPGDPRNPMQGVKIYFREPWYFIHGTNDSGSIGTAASHGCIRMRPREAKSLARRIAKHGSVSLIIQH